MSGSFEKSVKGGTKIKLAPPKAKYVEHILVATHAGDAGVAEIFRVLQYRLRDSTWTIVFKSLILVHLMIREGEPDVTLKYLADSPSKLAISNFSDGTFKEYKAVAARGPTELQVQGTNIRHYYNYILARAKAFRDTKVDWVRGGTGRLKRQTVDKGLLRETEAVQNQINSLLKCDLLSSEAENEITVCAFRLLTMDLLVLYGIMNEGTINVLEHYFEMSKPDAQRALNIYKTFAKQTNLVVDFLGTARQYENATRLEIPKLKHAPTSLTSSLEEYLNDSDFEVNRRQYLAEQDLKKGKKPMPNSLTSGDAPKKAAGAPGPKQSAAMDTKVAPQTQPGAAAPKGPGPDLIDFFESIEQNQQPMAMGAPQPTGFQNPQQTGFFSQPNFAPQNGQQMQAQQMNGGFGGSNPFGQDPSQQPQQQQQNFTGANYAAISSQPYSSPPQDAFSNMSQTTSSSFPSQQQPFSTGQTSFAPTQQSFNTGQSQPSSSNPFRQSMFPQPTGHSPSPFQSSPPIPSAQDPQSTNPFARSATMPVLSQPSNSPFTSPPPQIPQQTAAPQLTPQRTGTNPFAPVQSQPHTTPGSPQPLLPNQTGSTNPFRQSVFVNQQTGQGWQSAQGSMGGLEQLPTVPVFPRSGQNSQQNPWS